MAHPFPPSPGPAITSAEVNQLLRDVKTISKCADLLHRLLTVFLVLGILGFGAVIAMGVWVIFNASTGN